MYQNVSQSIPQYIPQNVHQYQYYPQYVHQNVHQYVPQNVAAHPSVSPFVSNQVYAPKNNGERNERDEKEYKNIAIKIGIEKATTPCTWTIEFANPYTPAIKKTLYNSFIKSCTTSCTSLESVISCIPHFNGSTIIDYTHHCPFWIIQHQKLHGIEIYYYAIKVVKNEMEKLFTFGIFKNISLIVIDEELIFTKDLKPKPSKDLLTMLFWSLNAYNDVKCVFQKKESKPIKVVEQSKEQPKVVIKTKLLAKLERYKDAMSKLDATDKDDLAELVEYQTKIEKVHTELNELSVSEIKLPNRDVKPSNVVYKQDPGAPAWSAIAKK